MRLERVDLLRPRITELLSSALEDPDEGVRTYAERAFSPDQVSLRKEAVDHLKSSAQKVAKQASGSAVKSKSRLAAAKHLIDNCWWESDRANYDGSHDEAPRD